MTEKQLLVYGARIRLGWFRKAEELGNVSAACTFYGIPRRTFYYWHKKWLVSGKQLMSLYDEPRTPLSHPRDPDEATVSLVVQLRLGMRYGEDALETVLKRDYGVNISHHGIGNILKRAGLLEKRKKKVRKGRRLSDRQYYPGEVGQMDVKHWKRSGYQYDIVDCATRIKYKRIYPGYNPAYRGLPGVCRAVLRPGFQLQRHPDRQWYGVHLRPPAAGEAGDQSSTGSVAQRTWH